MSRVDSWNAQWIEIAQSEEHRLLEFAYKEKRSVLVRGPCVLTLFNEVEQRLKQAAEKHWERWGWHPYARQRLRMYEPHDPCYAENLSSP